MFISCIDKTEKTNAVRENITESVYASAIVKTENQYQVFATVNGIINKLFVTENDLVKKGAPLMQVTDESSTIDRKKASLESSYAEVSANREKLAEAKNSIALAQSKASNDSLLYQRQTNLWNESIGSKTELEQRELAYENSKSLLESAKLRYKEMVTPQTPLAVVGDADVFVLEMQIDEYDIAKIKLGQVVLLSMDSYRGEVYEATVSKIIPIMNQRSKSFTVEAVFVKKPPVLHPNLTAEANIIIQTKKDALTIPRNYLVDDSLVMVRKDKMKKVITGLKDYQKVEIINGLTSNEVIYKPQ